MRVKIGNEWFDSNEQPICVQLNETEQEQIGGMDRTVATDGKYAVFPDVRKMTPEEMFEWMSD